MNVENKKISVFDKIKDQDLDKDRNNKLEAFVSIKNIIAIIYMYCKMNHD